MVQTIGILGGMGPEATNQLNQLITELTPASKDQDHIPVITYSNPHIPDRTEAILGRGPSPLLELIKSARLLEKAGADFLIMPCSTAHFFVTDLQGEINIPLLNMVEESVEFVKETYPGIKRVGLLATTGTVSTKIYDDTFTRKGIEVVLPSTDEQKELVMRAIYGPSGIKSGGKKIPRLLLLRAAKSLIEKGAEGIVLGCTEIPLVIDLDEEFVTINPSRIIASKAVNLAITNERILTKVKQSIEEST